MLVEELGRFGVSGSSEVIGVFSSGGASSARTKERSCRKESEKDYSAGRVARPRYFCSDIAVLEKVSPV